MVGGDRTAQVGAVLESLAAWSRVLGSVRSELFDGAQLSRSQVDALFLVAHGRTVMAPGDLSRSLGITPGAVTQLVDGLRADGLVTQSLDPADARRRVVTLTPNTARRLRAFEQRMVRDLAPRFADLSDSDLADLAGLLGRTQDVR